MGSFGEAGPNGRGVLAALRQDKLHEGQTQEVALFGLDSQGLVSLGQGAGKAGVRRHYPGPTALGLLDPTAGHGMAGGQVRLHQE